MGKIKSAIELAMEKTVDLKGDKEALRKSNIAREGKISISTYLENPQKSDIDNKLKLYKGKESAWFKSGALDTILANITLPRLEADLGRLDSLNDVLTVVSGKKKYCKDMFNQISQLFRQYLNSLDQMEESLKQQYAPQLRQKEMKLRQQTGQEIHLSPEQDPEFLKILSEQISKMDQQYNHVLKKAKEQIKQDIL